MATYLRDNLENYGPASNLMHNEKVREMIADGRPIYHFGFGQSPFPLLETAVESLKRHASKAAYLPVAGLYFFVFITKTYLLKYTERTKKRRVNFIPKFHSSLKKFIKYFTMITKRYMYGTKVQNFIGL